MPPLGDALAARFKVPVGFVACGSVFLAFVASVAVFLGLRGLAPEARQVVVPLFDWIDAGALHVPLALLVDPLSVVMILVVTGVGFLIHVYSTGYMAHDPSFRRFFLYLNLFMFAMLTLVLADNFLLVFSATDACPDHPEANLEELAGILVRLSQLVTDFPEIVELDINPVIVVDQGAQAVDARVAVEPSGVASPQHLVISPYPSRYVAKTVTRGGLAGRGWQATG